MTLAKGPQTCTQRWDSQRRALKKGKGTQISKFSFLLLFREAFPCFKAAVLRTRRKILRRTRPPAHGLTGANTVGGSLWPCCSELEGPTDTAARAAGRAGWRERSTTPSSLETASAPRNPEWLHEEQTSAPMPAAGTHTRGPGASGVGIELAAAEVRAFRSKWTELHEFHAATTQS